MPIKKWLKPNARRSEATKELRPRLEIVEAILMRTAPKWNGKKITKSMTLKEACAAEGISDMTFRNWRMESDKIWKYYKDMVASRKEMLHTMIAESAMANVLEVIGWWVKVRPMDKANLSMRYLEKTDSEMNQSIKIDMESSNVNLSMTSEEMEQRIMELATTLWLNNLKITNQDNEQRELHTSSSPTNDNEE